MWMDTHISASCVNVMNVIQEYIKSKIYCGYRGDTITVVLPVSVLNIVCPVKSHRICQWTYIL